MQQQVKLGISDDKNVEILSGLNTKDIVVLRSKKFVLPKSNIGNNPFVPFGQKKDSERKK